MAITVEMKVAEGRGQGSCQPRRRPGVVSASPAVAGLAPIPKSLPIASTMTKTQSLLVAALFSAFAAVASTNAAAAEPAAAAAKPAATATHHVAKKARHAKRHHKAHVAHKASTTKVSAAPAK